MIYENSCTEYKREFTPAIKNGVIAFANTGGGTVFVGLEDDGAVHGIRDVDDTLTRITNMLRDAILPDITMFVHYEVLPTSVIKITVQEGTNKPYFLAEKGMKPSGIYVRQGASSAHATWEQIRQMIKQTDGDRYEIARCFEQDLTFVHVAEEFKKRNVEFIDMKFVNLGIKSPADLYTNLGLLMSDQCQHTIKVAVFEGVQKRVFKDRKEFSGSVLRQLRDVYDYLYLSNKIEAKIVGLERVDSKDYPDDAIREALLNTIVHRDYSFSGSSIVNIYDNRMEFISLGGLVYGLSMQDIMMGISQARNEKLVGIFFRLKHIEAYGTGIQKIFDLYDGCEQQPSIRVSDSAFVLELPNINFYKHHGARAQAASGTQSLPASAPNQQQRAVIDYIRECGSMTLDDVQTLLGVKQTRSFVIIKEMLANGFIRVEGKGKTKHYMLAEYNTR
ncbi:MAG: putative DNA binding domain-containing protein [Bacillota bacterium]|nr:putative DNA binding domain-containing protein [Bacillota bacterium]